MKSLRFGLGLLLVATGLSQTACRKDYLDLTPNNSITDDNFYKTQEDAIRAVNATYTPLLGLYNGAAWQLLDIMSDNSEKGGGGANDASEIYELDNFTLNSTNTTVNIYYTQCYQGIQRANIVLAKVPLIAGMDPTIRQRCMGEALFLRGYYYYMLVRLFGDVPLYTKPITLKESFSISRSPKATVYETIIADLKAAADSLPKARYIGDDRGRVNSGSAKGMLASVYLTLGQKEAAATAALDVINSGVYSLNTNYADNFDETKENGPESMFEIQYRNAGQVWSYYGQSSIMNCWMAPRAQNVVASSGYGFNIPTPEFVAKYERDNTGKIIDKRRQPTMWMPGDKYGDYTQPASLEGSPNGYNVRKYFVPISNTNADAGGWSCSKNAPVMRYAEVLLIAAEAKGPAEGLTYINQVRRRAGLPDLQGGLSDANYLEAVYKERQLELGFEMHRWFDLIRHPDPAYMVRTMTAQGKNAQDKHMLMPIPQGERDKNPNLTQNLGY